MLLLASDEAKNPTWAVEVIDNLESPRGCDERKIAEWRLLWEAQDLRIRLDVRKFLFEQAYGKAVQRTEVTGKDGAPVKLEHAIFDPTKLSEKDLAEAERLIESAFAGADPR
jgi:hypothetical protein